MYSYLKITHYEIPLSVEGNNNVCKTVSCPQINKKCVLPFTHNGRTHTRCPIDPDDSSKFWCSTKVDNRGNHVVGQREYGHCSPRLCPLESKPPAFKPSPSPAPGIRPNSNFGCSGNKKCKSFVECSSKYRFSRKAQRCTMGDGGIGICCKDFLNNKGKIYSTLV